MKQKTVGILGYGALGKYLLEALQARPAEYTVLWVWNRSLEKVPTEVAAPTADVRALPPVDLAVEVAHPRLLEEHGQHLLDHVAGALFVGSPTCFASVTLDASRCPVYIPVGALWGAQDIAKMAARGTLERVTVTMAKNPTHLQGVEGAVQEALAQYERDESDAAPRVLYYGPVGPLCPLAPNNVNTMACAAIVGVGWERTVARLVADKTLEAHVVTVEVEGKGGFNVKTVRTNPAKPGAVTGSATFASFLSSLLAASGKQHGIHLV